MVTALTAYYGSGVPAGLSTALNVTTVASTVSGLTTTAEYPKNGTGWTILSSGGTTALTLAGSEPGPNSDGFLWPVTTLEGQQIVSGNWQPAVTLSAVASGFKFNVVVRAFVFNGGTFTQIGADMAGSGIIVGSTPVTTVIPAVAFPAQTFHTGDKLYLDVLTEVVTGNGNNTAANRRVNFLVNYRSGAMVTTPGYQLAPVSPFQPAWPYMTRGTPVIGTGVF